MGIEARKSHFQLRGRSSLRSVSPAVQCIDPIHAMRLTHGLADCLDAENA